MSAAPAAGAPDRAYWFTWYDLPEGSRDEFCAWLHAAYLPQVLARPGVLWGAHYACERKPTVSGAPGRLQNSTDAAVPAGSGYIVMFGAAASETFVAPRAELFHASLAAADRRMLALRGGVRSHVMIEDARIEGPAIADRADMTPSACIQIGNFNAHPDLEDEANDWFLHWRMPCMAKLPGCVRMRKLVCVSGWARHAGFYEFTSMQARNAHFLDHEKHAPEMEAWTDRLVRKLVHAPGSPYLAQRMWPPVA